jgi:hypothetical protein
VVVGTTRAATGATSTGVEVTTVLATAFAALPFAAGLGASTTGAGTGTGAGAATSFLATAFTGLAVLEVAEEFICIPEDKEVLEGIIRRFLPNLLICRVINFGKLNPLFFISERKYAFSF